MYIIPPWTIDADIEREKEIKSLKEIIRNEYDKIVDLFDGKIQTAVISTRKILKAIVLINYCSFCCETVKAFEERKARCDLTKEFRVFGEEIGSILYSKFLYYYNFRGKRDFVCSIVKFHSRDYYANRYECNTVHSDEMREIGAYLDLKSLYNGLTELIHTLELIYGREFLLKNRVLQVKKEEMHENQQTEILNDGSKNTIKENKIVDIKELQAKLTIYKSGPVEWPAWLRKIQLPTHYENEYLLVDCYESSNTAGAAAKMWSIIFYPKKDFRHLETYLTLSKITRVKITKVRDNSERWAIRFYDMTKNPTADIVIEILKYIFGK